MLIRAAAAVKLQNIYHLILVVALSGKSFIFFSLFNTKQICLTLRQRYTKFHLLILFLLLSYVEERERQKDREKVFSFNYTSLRYGSGQVVWF